MKPNEIEVVKQFFFRGMLDGYVNPNSVKFKDLRVVFPTVHFEMPGSNCKFYCKDIDDKKLQLVDLWFSTGISDLGGGMTVIWVNDEPVWMMNYGGRYRKEAIPTLKLVLRTSYEKKEFNGGRGPSRFFNGDFYYSNEPTGDFCNFFGREDISITNERNEPAAWFGGHHYHGFLLVPVEE